MNISRFLNVVAQQYSSRYVFCDSTERLTYAMLLRRSDSLAQRLGAMGCGLGSRVLVVANGGEAYMELLLACMQIGAQFLPVSVRSGREALLRTLWQLSPDAVFLRPEIARTLGADLREAVPLDSIVVLGTCPPYTQFSRLTRKHDRFQSGEIPRDTPIVGVVREGQVVESLSYGTVADFLARHGQMAGESGTVLVCIPYISISYVVEVLAALARGAHLVLLQHVSPKNILKATAKYGVTEMMLTPSLLRVIYRDAQFFRGDLKSVRTLRLGLAYLDADVIRSIRCLFAPECVILKQLDYRFPYARLQLRVDSLEIGGSILHMRVNSVGKTLPDVTLCAMDSRRNILGPGERGMLHFRLSDDPMGEWQPLGKTGLVDREGYVFLDYRSLPRRMEIPACISRVIAGGDSGEEARSATERLPLYVYDELLEDFSLAAAQADVAAMLSVAAGAILSHMDLAALAIVFPMQAVNMKLNTDEVMNEIDCTSSSPRTPARFFIPGPAGVREVDCGGEGFPHGLTLLYYPLHSAEGHLVGELYMGLQGREALSAFEKVQAHVVIKHLSFCLSSFDRRLKADAMLALLKAALDQIDDGVGISDIGETPALLYANRASARFIHRGKTDPAFGELLEKSQTQNMYSLKFEGREESSTSYFYTDEQGRKTWVNYVAKRICVGGDEYAVCVNNMRQDSPSVSHLDGLLSSRELVVLELISAGLTNREAAKKLQISDNTVKYHLSHIYEKLGVKNRAELLASTYLRRRATDEA